MLMVAGVALVILVAGVLLVARGGLPDDHEQTRAPEVPAGTSGAETGEARPLAGRWPRPGEVAEGADGAVPLMEPVLRGNEGVIYRKDPRTGAVELIVDPFPEDDARKRKWKPVGNR